MVDVTNEFRYDIASRVIKSFRDRDTGDLWAKGASRRLSSDLCRIALRKLWMLQNAAALDDLKSPAGNRLESLKGDRQGQFSIRINDRYRICFRWADGHAHDVEIVDYHRG